MNRLQPSMAKHEPTGGCITSMHVSNIFCRPGRYCTRVRSFIGEDDAIAQAVKAFLNDDPKNRLDSC